MKRIIVAATLLAMAFKSKRSHLLAAILCFSYLSALSQVTFLGTQIPVLGTTLSSPTGLAADIHGNLFAADTAHNRVLFYPLNGGILGAPSVLANNLSNPTGVTVDWFGNLYITDNGNNQVVMLPVTNSSYGTALVIATGFNNPSGIAVDILRNVYVADTGNNQITKIPFLGPGYGAPIPISTGLAQPRGVAVDSRGSVYIADTNSGQISRITPSGVTYSAVQVLWRGMGAPASVNVDSAFNVYVTETANNTVVEWPWDEGPKQFHSAIVLGANLASPSGVVPTTTGVFVADTGHNQILRVVNQSPPFPPVNLNMPVTTQTYFFSIKAGTTIGAVQTYTNGHIRGDFVDPGTSTCIPQFYPAATLCGIDVTFNPQSRGAKLGAVAFFDPAGNMIQTCFISGIAMGMRPVFIPGVRTVIATGLSSPSGVAIDGSNNLFVSDTDNNAVVKFTWNGSGYDAKQNLAISGLSSPAGLAMDTVNNLYVASNGNDKVVKVSYLNGLYSKQATIGIGIYGPTGLTIDLNGSVYIADTYANSIEKLAWTGNSYAPATLVKASVMRFPLSVAVDMNGSIFFVNPYWANIGKLVAGIPQTTLPIYNLLLPVAVNLDGNGNVYILDSVANCVFVLPWNGTSYGLPTVLAAGFNNPQAMTLDDQGNIYVADTGNNQIVKLDLSTPPPMSFASTYIGSVSKDGVKHEQVMNLGDTPLSLDSLSFPDDFQSGSGTATDCSPDTNIPQSSFCQIGVQFLPRNVATVLHEAVTLQFSSPGEDNKSSTLFVQGTSIALQTQTISFLAPSQLSYNTAPVPLNAQASSGLQVTYCILSGPALLVGKGSQLQITGIGLVRVSASQGGNAMNYPAVTVIQTILVVPAPLLVIPVNAISTYGSQLGSFKYTISGLIPGEYASAVVSGNPLIVCECSSKSPKGIYALTPSIGTLTASNYTFSMSTAQMTIVGASLTVSADSLTMTYGSMRPQFGYHLTGFVNGDTLLQLRGAPSITTAASSISTYGSYSLIISPGTLAADNYSLVMQNGTLQVTPAVLTVIASDKQMTYGDPVSSTSYSITGLQNGETPAVAFRGTPVLNPAVSTQSAPGTYQINVSIGSLTSINYKFLLLAGKMSVVKAVLQVIPQNATRIYGGAEPKLSYSLSGFVNGDTAATRVNGAPVITSVIPAGLGTGSFPISASLGWLSSSYYTFQFQTAVLSVTPATIVVTPKPGVMTYGCLPPAPSYVFVGLAASDSVNAILGAPSSQTNVSANSPVGTYTVSLGIGTLTALNYTFSLLPGTLQVQKAILNVQANSASMTYGSIAPAATFQVSGFMNNDDMSAVSGAPVTTTNIGPGTSVGSYPITMTVGTLYATNYSFKVINGTMTIRPAALTVSANSAQMSYGAPLPWLSYSFSGLLNGDIATNMPGMPLVSTSANRQSPAGIYPIHCYLATLQSKNYVITALDGSLTINPAPLTVIALNQTVTYGSNLPSLTYKLTGLLNGDVPTTAASGVPDFTTTASSHSNIGQYPLTVAAGRMTAANYRLQFVPGMVFIVAAPLAVSADNLSKFEGASLPTLTYTGTGWVNGDSFASASTGAPSISSIANSKSPAGSYPIVLVISSLHASNYQILLKNGTLAVTKQLIAGKTKPQPAPLPVVTRNMAPAILHAQ